MSSSHSVMARLTLKSPNYCPHCAFHVILTRKSVWFLIKQKLIGLQNIDKVCPQSVSSSFLTPYLEEV